MKMKLKEKTKKEKMKLGLLTRFPSLIIMDVGKAKLLFVSLAVKALTESCFVVWG